MKTTTQQVADRITALIGGDQGARARLADHCGVSRQAVSGWTKTGRIGKDKLQLVADFFGVPVASLLPDQSATAPGWMPQNGFIGAAILHKTPGFIRWEDMVSGQIELPDEFVIEMPDDSMTPGTPAGTRLICSKSAPPTPGGGVLVVDAGGAFAIRSYRAGPSGRWSAIARNDGYADMDSITDGLQVIAAVTWRGSGAM